MAESLHVVMVIPVAVLALLIVRDRASRYLAGYVLLVSVVFYVYIASVGGFSVDGGGLTELSGSPTGLPAGAAPAGLVVD